MKGKNIKKLFIILLSIFLFVHKNVQCKTEKSYSAEKNVRTFLSALIRNTEKSEKLTTAYSDLDDACNTNECTITDETSLKILQKYNLANSEGRVIAGTCEALKYVMNNLGPRGHYTK